MPQLPLLWAFTDSDADLHLLLLHYANDKPLLTQLLVHVDYRQEPDTVEGWRIESGPVPDDDTMDELIADVERWLEGEYRREPCRYLADKPKQVSAAITQEAA